MIQIALMIPQQGILGINLRFKPNFEDTNFEDDNTSRMKHEN